MFDINMDDFVEVIDKQIRKRIAGVDFLDTGVITAINGTSCLCDLTIHGTAGQLQLKGVPIMLPNATSGTSGSGFYVLPKIGDEVVVAYLEMNKKAPMVIGSYFNTLKYASAFQTNPNIWELKHPSGSLLRFLSGGEVRIESSGGAYIRLKDDGGVVINCAPTKKIQYTRS